MGNVRISIRCVIYRIFAKCDLLNLLPHDFGYVDIEEDEIRNVARNR